MRRWGAIAGIVFGMLTIVAPAAQAPRFEAVQKDLFAAGANLVNAWADYDGDGDLDLFVGFDGQPNRLYRNDAGTFADVAREAGVADARSTRAAAWGDFDADGDSDLLLGFAPGAGSVLRLYRNEHGKFTDVTDTVGLTTSAGAVRQPSWVDVDNDHDLDLFIAFRDRANALFQNTGGTFTDIAAQVGLDDKRRTVGAAWFDFDLDGDLDLIVGNMDGDANGLYRHDKGRFTDIAASPDTGGIEWGGRTPNDKSNGTVRPCVADVNNDGLLDVFTANYGKNGLFLNRGGGKFEYAAVKWGVDIEGRYDTCAFGDMDNDGDLDLYVNGTITGGTSYPDYLFENMGERFEDVTPPDLKALHADHGAHWADFDRDGDLDLALTGSQAKGMHLLFRNVLPPAVAARSLQIHVTDARGRNTMAGAVVYVYAAKTRRVLATRIVDSGSGYDSQNDMPLHIGLRTPDPVDIHLRYGGPGGTKSHVTTVDPRRYQGGKVLELRPPS